MTQAAGHLKRKLQNKEKKKRWRLNAQPLFKTAICMVATEMEIDAIDMCLHYRTPVPTRARMISMYLMSVVYNWQPYRIGDLYDRDRVTVIKAIAKIEDERDDVEFDGWIEQLGDRLRTATRHAALPGRTRANCFATMVAEEFVGAR